MTQPQERAEKAADEMRLPVNHDEAFLLAFNKRDESNLARCYLALTAENKALREAVIEEAAKVAEDFTGEFPARDAVVGRIIAHNIRSLLRAASLTGAEKT